MASNGNSENFKQYSLNPINGTSFKGQLGNRVIFEIPPTHFVKGREDFRLNLKLLNTSPSKQRLGVPATVGAASVINRIDFFNLSGELLESLHNYNQIASIINQYDFDDANNISSIEGVSRDNTARLFTGNADAHVAVVNSRSVNKPEDMVISPIDKTNGEAKYNSRLFSIDVKAGLLSAFDNKEKLVPLPILNGLRIMIYLEDPNIALVNVTAPDNQSLVTDGLKCLNVGGAAQDFVLVEGNGDYAVDPVAPNSQAVEITDTNINEQNVAYKVGDLITIYGTANAAAFSVPAVITGFATNVDKLVINYTAPDGNPVAIPNQIDPAYVRFTVSDYTIENIGFAVGNVCDIVSLTDPVPANYPAENKRITAIAFDAASGKVKVSFSANDIPQDGTDVHLRLSQTDKQYEIEPELRIMSVMPEGFKYNKGDKINYQFTTYDFFINTVPSQSRNFQIDIPSVSTMAKAIFTMYANVNKLNDAEASNYFVGQYPEESHIDSVQYYINNKYQPLRPYNPQVHDQKVINQHELFKALNNINSEAKNMGFSEGANLNDYTNTYMHALRLAKGDFIFDLSEAEPQIRVSFDNTRTFNMNAYTYVFCNKIITNDGSGVRVLQ